MANQYFQNIPSVPYGNLVMKNLMTNARIPQSILNSGIRDFYPYTLQEGETPTAVAYNIYGSVDFVWLVYFSNSIIDPTTQWYKSQQDFDAFIVDKFGSIAEAQSQILFYKNIDDPTYPLITAETYQLSSPGFEIPQAASLYPIDAYMFYESKNRARQTILLVDRKYAQQIALDLEKALK